MNVWIFKFLRLFLSELVEVLAEAGETRTDLKDVGEVFQHIIAVF